MSRFNKTESVVADQKLDNMSEQLEDQQIIVKKLEATIAEQVEPFVHTGKNNSERIKKLETKVRDLNESSENKRLEDIE